MLTLIFAATLSHIRMRLMEYRFEFHTLLNGNRESDAMKVPIFCVYVVLGKLINIFI
mgnify:CR=1 FL=1